MKDYTMTKKIIYITERQEKNGDNHEIAVSWDRKTALSAAEEDYNHVLPRYRSKNDWILWGRYYDGDQTDVNAAWAEMLDDAWLSDDTIAECETLNFAVEEDFE